MDDIGGGAVKYLATFTSVTSLLGAFTDPTNNGQPWLFKGDGGAFRGVPVTVQSTSQAALVCSSFGGVSVAPPLTTPRMLRLNIEIFMDPLRDASLNITETPPATEGRARAVFNAVHHVLQRTNPDTVAWGDVVTTGCQLLTEPQFMLLQGGDGDGLMYGSAFYEVDTFGYLDIVTG